MFKIVITLKKERVRALGNRLDCRPCWIESGFANLGRTQDSQTYNPQDSKQKEEFGSARYQWYRKRERSSQLPKGI